VDDILIGWGRSVRQSLRRKFGVDVDSEKWFGREDVTLQQWEYVWSDEGVREIFGTGESFPGSIRAAQKLCRMGRVRILTACPSAAHQPRIDWLRARRVPYAEIRFVDPPGIRGHVGTDGIKHASKSSITPHCDVYIDDNSNNCDELVKNTKAKVILLDHSWNRGSLAPKSRSKRLVRAMNWDDVIREVARVRSAKR
jgi:hypothetical protein